MKRILIYCSLVLLMGMQAMAQVQVVDLRTGITGNTYGSGSLMGNNSSDDTWAMCYPWEDETNLSSYDPLYCGIGTPQGWAPYGGASTNVKWLAPVMAPSGEHQSSPAPGLYSYRMQFDRDPGCIVTSAEFHFDHIMADDAIQKIIINGHIVPVYYTLYPNVDGFTVNPAFFVPGVNEIRLEVWNWGDNNWQATPTGIQIDGKLTLVNGPNPSFCLSTPSASSLIATSAGGSGTHTWEMYSSPTGNLGSYAYICTINGPTVDIDGAGPCYLVKHTITTAECGTACESQSVCHQTCDEGPGEASCDGITAPKDLRYNPATNLLSWSHIAGATYKVEIIVNDPACCESGLTQTRPVPKTYTTNFHTINYLEDMDVFVMPSCFSFRVTAICPDGSTATSVKQCVFPNSGGGIPDGITGFKSEQEETQSGNIDAKLFPNPAKGVVSIDITTKSETAFKVIIMDAGGKTVQVFNNLKTTGNKYSLKWNSDAVNKGTYLVKIETAGKQTITRKCIVE